MYSMKKAFTIAEIMMVMAIMAIMIMAFMQTDPLTPKYKSLYYYTYQNIKKFGGEVVAKKGNSALDTDDATFCTNLIKGLNTVGGSNSCAVFYNATIAAPFTGMADADIENPSFSIVNGQRYYVSKRVAGAPGYRIISVDLNGKSRPNTLKKDVVPFAMYDTGEVLPLADPVDDTTYLTVSARKYSVSSGRPLLNPYVENSSGKRILTFREGFCLTGSPTSYANYCTNSPAITVAPGCEAGNAATFCKFDLIKPLIDVKI